jgi:putative transposase
LFHPSQPRNHHESLRMSTSPNPDSVPSWVFLGRLRSVPRQAVVGKDSLIAYIQGQAEHHRTESLLDEYRRLLRENGVPYDERYLP